MMKILHLNAGNETGGGMYHIIHLLERLTSDKVVDVTLGLFEKKELYHLARKKGIKTVYFPNRTRFSYPLIKRIAKYIVDENITIVHTHGPRANVYVNMIQEKVPFYWITTVHSDPTFDFKHKSIYGKLLYRLHINALKNAHKIITVCDAFKPSLTRSFINKDKITTVLNGLNFKERHDKHLNRKELGFTDDHFLLLQVARLERVKGHHIALQAFANLTNKIKNCHLLFVGGGTLKKELHRLAKTLNIHEHVTFFGEQRHVNDFYKLADITLLSSLSEGFPLVLLESARAKTPIISTDVGGVNQLIVNDDVGWRVKPNCANRLSKAMKEAYEFKRNGKLSVVGENLYKHASQKFSLEKFANNVYNIYLDIDIV